MKSRGAADALIVLDDDKVMETLKAEAARQGIQLTDDKIVELKPQIYAELKRQVAAAAPQYLQQLQDFESFGVAQVRFTSATAMLQVLQRPEVAGVRQIDTYKHQLKESLPLVNAPKANQAGFTGEGTTIAVLDSGVDYTRDAFGRCTKAGAPSTCRVIVAADVGTSDNMRDDPESFHGTNVSGIVIGVAPKTQLAVLDVFDRGPSASDSAILTGLDWVLKNAKKYHIVAVNMSLGASQKYITTACGDSQYAGVVSDLRRAGVLVVVAAGNDGKVENQYHNGVTHPACVPGVISVGAVYDANIGGKRYGTDCTDDSTKADQIVCWSQSGPTLGVLAPGVLITAAGVTEGGTSQAAPHVAGAIADLASKCPGAKPDQIEKAIVNSGPSINDKRNNLTRHRLDVLAAGQALQSQGLCKK
jgi:subtilisin family serine protease